jgi:hypothetical protein
MCLSAPTQVDMSGAVGPAAKAVDGQKTAARSVGPVLWAASGGRM